MTKEEAFAIATSGATRVPDDWMPATGTRSLVFEDPIVLWLEFHGERNGFAKDPSSPYEFSHFIFEKAKQFEAKWIATFAPEAVRVCEHGYDVRNVDRLRQTVDLMGSGTPVIAGPALWWAPERVLGVPDLLVRSDWLRKTFPKVRVPGDADNQYVVLDMKFTTKLDSTDKKVSFSNYAAQVRIYSYIAGRLTGQVASAAYLFCRDRIDDPVAVPVRSTLGALDKDLAELRDRYLEIKLRGDRYVPGRSPEIAANLANDQDDPWHSAKLDIARNRVPGGDSSLLYEIGSLQKAALATHGFDSLKAVLGTPADEIPLESCKGLGAAKCPRIRAVIKANQTASVSRGKVRKSPSVTRFEFFVDFETLNNLNVDFDKQWPSLEGKEMIFMIGIYWVEQGQGKFEALVATEESAAGETKLLQNFHKVLRAKTNLDPLDPAAVTLFHWTSAEVWQLKRACDRQGLDTDHALRNLPWYDIQKDFLSEPIGVPGAWGYGIKEVVPALGLVKWPGDLDDGLRASVAGWKAYQSARPLETAEMRTIVEYNEVDCRALYEATKWLRS